MTIRILTMNALIPLTTRLDEAQHRLGVLDKYYAAEQPLSFLDAEAREDLGRNFGTMAVNIPRTVVGALSERLRVTGFTGLDVAEAWSRTDLDQKAGVIHREALTPVSYTHLRAHET